MDFEAWSTENLVRSIEYLSWSMEYREWNIGYEIWTMAYGILNMEYGMWNVECGMDSAGACCSKTSRCIFDAQGIGAIWDADRIEGRASARPEDSGIPWSLGTRAPSNLHGEPGSFLRVSDLRINRRRNKSAPSPKMSSKRLPKWVPIEYPSFLEELLKCLHAKRLQYRIRTCLLMFAAHLVACKSNIFVIRGCNIDANMVPNLHAENGHTFKRKVSNMMSKCGPEGVPKMDRKANSNGNLRFWTRSGESA